MAPTAFGSAGLYGGGERYPIELARALAKQVACELVTFGREPMDQRQGGLTVRVLRPILHLGGHPARPIAPGLPPALRGADLVHAHQVRSPASIVAAIAARVHGVPTAVTDHGLLGSDWAGLVPRVFDRFLLVSRHSADVLRAPPERTQVIYGGADPNRFRPDPSVKRSGILFVGRVTPHKGLEVLIRALPDDVELSVAGSEGHDPQPPERDYPALLRRIAHGRRVRFLGRVADADLPSLYRSAQMVVLPSLERTCFGKRVAVSELLGLAALEAMASGTPVIASRIGGLPEVIVDGETGRLVPPGDVEALRETLRALLADPRTAERLGRRARERVVAEFTWDRCAERCLAAYQELLAAPSG